VAALLVVAPIRLLGIHPYHSLLLLLRLHGERMPWSYPSLQLQLQLVARGTILSCDFAGPRTAWVVVGLCRRRHRPHRVRGLDVEDF